MQWIQIGLKSCFYDKHYRHYKRKFVRILSPWSFKYIDDMHQIPYNASAAAFLFCFVLFCFVLFFVFWLFNLLCISMYQVNYIRQVRVEKTCFSGSTKPIKKIISMCVLPRLKFSRCNDTPLTLQSDPFIS